MESMNRILCCKLAALALMLGLDSNFLFAAGKTEFRLATFSADVTVPMGHALMGGGIKPAQKVADPLCSRWGLSFSKVLVFMKWNL